MIVCHDWKGEPIYEDDNYYYYDTDLGLVPEDDIQDYIDQIIGEPITIEDYIQKGEAEFYEHIRDDR